MEHTDILELMSTLKLYDMRAAYDEMMTTGIKRRHEPPHRRRSAQRRDRREAGALDQHEDFCVPQLARVPDRAWLSRVVFMELLIRIVGTRFRDIEAVRQGLPHQN